MLEIFNFCRISGYSWRWARLVHVCRRWRRIIFASPCRLHLQLVCTQRTPFRNYLAIWPPFPILIDYFLDISAFLNDNVIAALEHSNRVCDLHLDIATTPQCIKLATVMQESFPALTHLKLTTRGPAVPVFQGGFLGGSAPCLQVVDLHSIPFPELPTLLLSARDLVTLKLIEIPPAGYISPEAMVTSLTASTRLESLSITFTIPTPHLERQHLHPLIRTILPAVTFVWFGGSSDYLEDLVTRIGCPRLNSLKINYRHLPVDFEVSQLFGFINRSEDPQLTHFEWVDICSFSILDVSLKLSRASRFDMAIWITFEDVERRGSHIVQVLGQFSANLFDVRHLKIRLHGPGSELGYNEWVQLLRHFSSLQTLCVRGNWALNDISGELVAKLFPALDLLCLDGPESSSPKVDAALRPSGRSISFVRTLWEFESYLEKLGKIISQKVA